MAGHTVVLFQHFALFRQKMTASAAQTAQKFPVERLAKACRTLFHVSASTFAGATAGMTGEYTVEEMQKHIDEWLGKEAVV